MTDTPKTRGRPVGTTKPNKAIHKSIALTLDEWERLSRLPGKSNAARIRKLLAIIECK